MVQISSQLPQYNTHIHEHDDVGKVLESFAEAVRNGVIDKIMSFYADDIVAYDMMPPLEFTTKASFKKAWQEYFTEQFMFPINYSFEKTRIDVAEDLAIVHTLIHLSGDTVHSAYMDNFLRCSMCLRQINGKWLITHQHNSVPLGDDMQGLLNLTPAEGEAPLH